MLQTRYQDGICREVKDVERKRAGLDESNYLRMMTVTKVDVEYGEDSNGRFPSSYSSNFL